MIADPFTKLQCCIRSDGAAAVILVAEDRVADLPHKPVWILGTGEATSHISMGQWPDFTTGPAAVAGGWRSSGPASPLPTSTCASCTTPSPTCC